MLEAPARLDEARRQLDHYFEGGLPEFDLPLDWRLTKGFRLRALRAIARIPYGQTRSYTEIARSAGNERAVRAAGTACGANPIPIVVPCHRVLRSGGGARRLRRRPADEGSAARAGGHPGRKVSPKRSSRSAAGPIGGRESEEKHPVLDDGERLPRVAWLFAFALPLALAMLLLGVKSSQAATPQAPMPGSPAFAAGFEEFEEAEEDEEAEEEEAGLEEELELEDVEEFEDEDEGLSEVEFAREECEMAEEEAAEGEIRGAEAKEVCAEAEGKRAKPGAGTAGQARTSARSTARPRTPRSTTTGSG